MFARRRRQRAERNSAAAAAALHVNGKRIDTDSHGYFDIRQLAAAVAPNRPSLQTRIYEHFGGESHVDNLELFVGVAAKYLQSTQKAIWKLMKWSSPQQSAARPVRARPLRGQAQARKRRQRTPTPSLSFSSEQEDDDDDHDLPMDLEEIFRAPTSVDSSPSSSPSSSSSSEEEEEGEAMAIDPQTALATLGTFSTLLAATSDHAADAAEREFRQKLFKAAGPFVAALSAPPQAGVNERAKPEKAGERHYGVSERAKELGVLELIGDAYQVGKRAHELYQLRYPGEHPPQRQVWHENLNKYVKMNLYTPTTSPHTLDKAIAEAVAKE